MKNLERRRPEYEAVLGAIVDLLPGERSRSLPLATKQQDIGENRCRERYDERKIQVSRQRQRGLDLGQGSVSAALNREKEPLVLPGHDLRLLSMALKASPKRDVAAFGDATVESLGGFGKFPLVHQGRPERPKRKAVLFAASVLRRNCQQSLGQTKRAFELAAVINVVPEPAGAGENGFAVGENLRKPPRIEVIALDFVRGVAAGSGSASTGASLVSPSNSDRRAAIERSFCSLGAIASGG